MITMIKLATRKPDPVDEPALNSAVCMSEG